MGEVWRDAGIHHADINPAPASRAEENPQNSKDSWVMLWRRTRWCQRCGHWIAAGSTSA